MFHYCDKYWKSDNIILQRSCTEPRCLDRAQYDQKEGHGHFPRVIALHVRDRGDLSLEQAIRKMTSMPAARIGSWNRGILSEGKYADIVIFDLEDIQDKATFVDLHQYPEGIEYVLVNGKIVVDHGKITGKLPGRILYGPGKK